MIKLLVIKIRSITLDNIMFMKIQLFPLKQQHRVFNAA